MTKGYLFESQQRTLDALFLAVKYGSGFCFDFDVREIGGYFCFFCDSISKALLNWIDVEQ